MRFAVAIIAALVTVAATNVPLAQSTVTPSPESRATCPPDVKGEPPTVGGGSSEPLSDKLGGCAADQGTCGDGELLLVVEERVEFGPPPMSLAAPRFTSACLAFVCDKDHRPRLGEDFPRQGPSESLTNTSIGRE